MYVYKRRVDLCLHLYIKIYIYIKIYTQKKCLACIVYWLKYKGHTATIIASRGY